jgi:hypothetical protein
MTLLTASAGDLYSALSGHELDVFQSAMTGALALLLTVNMIIERREFLDMLIRIETAHSTLSREFKGALVGIKRFSSHIRDAERLDVEEVRRLAAEIHRDVERLDGMLEELLTDDEAEAAVAPAEAQVNAAAGVVVAGTAR